MRTENAFTVAPAFRAAHAGLKPGASSFYIFEARSGSVGAGGSSDGHGPFARIPFPRPLGGEGGEPPALSSAGARRGPHVLLVVGVRGSTTVSTAETMNNVRPYRTTRSLARRGVAIQKAHELRRTPTDAEQAPWCHSSRTASSRRRRNHVCRKSWTSCGRYRRRLDKTLDYGPPHPSRTG